MPTAPAAAPRLVDAHVHIRRLNLDAADEAAVLGGTAERLLART